MLDADVTLADVKAHMDETRPPVYVSSVTYGRMVLFTFESRVLGRGDGRRARVRVLRRLDVSGQVSVTYKDIISKSKITAFILGGDAGTAVKTIDSYDELIDVHQERRQLLASESPGAPIAYKLSYLRTTRRRACRTTTDYDVKDCTRVSQKVHVSLNSIAVDSAGGDSGDDLELYGNITVRRLEARSRCSTRTSSNYVGIHEGSQFGQPDRGGHLERRSPGRPSDSVQRQPQGPRRLFARRHDRQRARRSAPFETGWRKDVTVNWTGDSARIRVVFSISPI